MLLGEKANDPSVQDRLTTSFGRSFDEYVSHDGRIVTHTSFFETTALIPSWDTFSWPVSICGSSFNVDVVTQPNRTMQQIKTIKFLFIILSFLYLSGNLRVDAISELILSDILALECYRFVTPCSYFFSTTKICSCYFPTFVCHSRPDDGVNCGARRIERHKAMI